MLYERFSATRRARLHPVIGVREERVYGAQAGERAALLAVHFERGRNYVKAIHYRHQAGESVALHKKHGVQRLYVQHEVAPKFGQYWDVAWFEKRLR